jgi:cathepsin E
MDNLFANGKVDANEIGIYFEPTNSVEKLNGEISWGKASELLSVVPVN